MSGAAVLLVLLFAVAIPLALWVAIENETSNPTVVDRTEAERIATEHGGRREARSNADPDRNDQTRGDSKTDSDGWSRGDPKTDSDWRTRDDRDRDDRWR